MARVVGKNCIGAIDRSCVEVCPVDCFYLNTDKAINEKYGIGPNKQGEYGMMMINPDECINCGACEPECPQQAIYEDSAMPADQQEFIENNAKWTTGLSSEEADKSRAKPK